MWFPLFTIIPIELHCNCRLCRSFLLTHPNPFNAPPLLLLYCNEKHASVDNQPPGCRHKV